ncbi:MAG: serine/threonine-protein phosphatase, partial [Firmicutes bacterium]|nr:serine/threonine-protein phosphatase [Bacillota bacterium]
GGHNRLPLLENENGRLEEVEVYGMPICSLFSSSEHETVTLTMHPGQRLLIYTDGIPEATNVQGEEFGLEGILRIWDSQDIKSPQRLLAALQARVVEFSGFAPEDDMTAMLVEFL